MSPRPASSSAHCLAIGNIPLPSTTKCYVFRRLRPLHAFSVGLRMYMRTSPHGCRCHDPMYMCKLAHMAVGVELSLRTRQCISGQICTLFCRPKFVLSASRKKAPTCGSNLWLKIGGSSLCISKRLLRVNSY